MTGDDEDDRDGQRPDGEPPWHESTSKLLGASAAGLAAIALIVWGATALSRDEPDTSPADFVDSTFSTSAPSGSASSTTSTVTTTRSIQTTEINPGDPALTPPPPPGPESSSTRSRTPRTEESEDDGPTTTRSRPRLNETRTLYPRPN